MPEARNDARKTSQIWHNSRAVNIKFTSSSADRSDNGPELLAGLSYKQPLQWHAIQCGRPMENSCVESFNGRFCDECLNENWFNSLADEREKIEQWGNTKRDHTAACSAVLQRSLPGSPSASTWMKWGKGPQTPAPFHHTSIPATNSGCWGE
jgi:hypothetical protein